MSLGRDQILKRLEKIMASEPDDLHGEISKLIRDARLKQVRSGVPIKNISYVYGSNTKSEWYIVEVSKEDQMRVEEIFADFLARKRLMGEWKTQENSHGKPEVIGAHLDMGIFRFRFYHEYPVKDIKVAKTPKKIQDDFEKSLDGMSQEKMLELLKNLQRQQARLIKK